MKNPDSKQLRIVYTNGVQPQRDDHFALVLSNLAIAESNLVRAGKDSALPHFIAVVKEIERLYGFEFRIIEDGK